MVRPDARFPPDDLDVRLLERGDADVLRRVAADVFDHPIDARWTREFLDDPRHHLAVAVGAGVVVGMASGVHYVHPDKGPEMWINEVGVAATHRGRGVATALLEALFRRARALGCREAWLLTEVDNAPARRLYARAGGSEAAERPVYVTFALAPREPDAGGEGGT